MLLPPSEMFPGSSVRDSDLALLLDATCSQPSTTPKALAQLG